MKNEFLPYARQSINEQDIDAVKGALKQNLITRGDKTREFEEALCQKLTCKYAVAFSSATTALYAAFQAQDVSPFDRFLTTPNSFIATTAAALRLGAKPTFIDIDRKNGNMCLEKLREELKVPMSRGRCVICPVHFSGIALDMQALDRAVKMPDVLIIEDAAHAIGSYYPDGSIVGSCAYSDMTVFSFHAIKTITCGEGGCVTTNSETYYKRLLQLRNSGIDRTFSDPWYYEVKDISGNYHMTEMQAALGLSQLQRLDAFAEKRRKIVSWYRELLQDVACFDPSYDERSCYHLMCVQIDFERFKTSRTEVMQKLHEKNIGSQYHYIPLYRHPAVAKVTGDLSERFPEMETYYKMELSLPLFVDLEKSDVEYVVEHLLGAIGHKKSRS